MVAEKADIPKTSIEVDSKLIRKMTFEQHGSSLDPQCQMIWKVYSVICSTNISNGENQVVSKSFDVPTVDASDKPQQQPDSTSSTSTLATTVTADGNSDLYKRQCCSLIPAKSDSLPHAHTQAFKVKHSTSRLLLLNKNVIGQKAQVHVILLFRNFNSHELPQCHQRSSKSIKIGKTVSLIKKRS
ncbi:hypothetical protein Tco_0528827 [Tanacetum coccineum]